MTSLLRSPVVPATLRKLCQAEPKTRSRTGAFALPLPGPRVPSADQPLLCCTLLHASHRVKSSSHRRLIERLVREGAVSPAAPAADAHPRTTAAAAPPAFLAPAASAPVVTPVPVPASYVAPETAKRPRDETGASETGAAETDAGGGAAPAMPTKRARTEASLVEPHPSAPLPGASGRAAEPPAGPQVTS